MIINPERREAYKEKLLAHRLILRKLNQLTDRLPNPDDAEIVDIVVLDLIEGDVNRIVEIWMDYFDSN